MSLLRKLLLLPDYSQELAENRKQHARLCDVVNKLAKHPNPDDVLSAITQQKNGLDRKPSSSDSD